MRKIPSGYYTPAVPPTTPEALPTYLQSSLNSIASVVNSSVKHITPLDRLPEKATDGDMVVVNNGMGTNQLKIFLNGAWVLIV